MYQTELFQTLHDYINLVTAYHFSYCVAATWIVLQYCSIASKLQDKYFNFYFFTLNKEEMRSKQLFNSVHCSKCRLIREIQRFFEGSPWQQHGANSGVRLPIITTIMQS